jgi:hypothetical protein
MDNMDKDVTVHLKKAKFGQLADTPSILLLGKRRTGKTTWARRIVPDLRNQADRFMVMGGTLDSCSEWKQLVHPLYVHTKSIDRLQQVRDYQDLRVKKYRDSNEPIPRHYKLVIVIDDCGSDRTFMTSKILKDLLSNARHYGITLMLCLQYLYQAPPQCRDNFDYIGVLFARNVKAKEKLWSEYASQVEFRVFKFILSAATADRGLLWIDNTKASDKVSDTLFVSRMNPPFHFAEVGSDQVREYGDDHYMQTSGHTNAFIEAEQAIAKVDEFSIWGTDDDETVVPAGPSLRNATYRDKKGSVTVVTGLKQD